MPYAALVQGGFLLHPAFHDVVAVLDESAGIREEEKVIEGHIECTRLSRLSKAQVIRCDTGRRPNETEPELTENAVGLF